MPYTTFDNNSTKAGATIMYGTSSYLWYKQNNLSNFVLQIIQNEMAAQKHIEQFEQKLIESIIGKDLLFKMFKAAGKIMLHS